MASLTLRLGRELLKPNALEKLTNQVAIHDDAFLFTQFIKWTRADISSSFNPLPRFVEKCCFVCSCFGFSSFLTRLNDSFLKLLQQRSRGLENRRPLQREPRVFVRFEPARSS